MATLTRKQESLIRALYSRHGRRKYGLCICEGVRCCREVGEARADLIDFAVVAPGTDASYLSCPIYDTSEEQLSKLSSTVTSQGIMLVCRRPEPITDTRPKDPFILILDGVSEPGNFGTILRTARAVGLTEVWYTAGSVDPFNDKVIRSASSAQFVLGLRSFQSLDQAWQALQTFGYNHLYRTDPHRGENCFSTPDLFQNTAIVMGGEAFGASTLAEAIPLTIPMPGDAESLNVAQAATVVLFEHVRRLQGAH